MADRVKFYDSLKDLTNKNIIIPAPRKNKPNQNQKPTPTSGKNTNNQPQKPTPDTSTKKAEPTKLRPPTTFIFTPTRRSEEDELNEREAQIPPNPNTHEFNADLNNDLSKMIFNKLKPRNRDAFKDCLQFFMARIHRGSGEKADYPKHFVGRGLLQVYLKLRDISKGVRPKG